MSPLYARHACHVLSLLTVPTSRKVCPCAVSDIMLISVPACPADLIHDHCLSCCDKNQIHERQIGLTDNEAGENLIQTWCERINIVH